MFLQRLLKLLRTRRHPARSDDAGRLPWLYRSEAFAEDLAELTVAT
jgi:hypothetical protein